MALALVSLAPNSSPCPPQRSPLAIYLGAARPHSDPPGDDAICTAALGIELRLPMQ